MAKRPCIFQSQSLSSCGICSLFLLLEFHIALKALGIWGALLSKGFSSIPFLSFVKDRGGRGSGLIPSPPHCRHVQLSGGVRWSDVFPRTQVLSWLTRDPPNFLDGSERLLGNCGLIYPISHCRLREPVGQGTALLHPEGLKNINQTHALKDRLSVQGKRNGISRQQREKASLRWGEDAERFILISVMLLRKEDLK